MATNGDLVMPHRSRTRETVESTTPATGGRALSEEQLRVRVLARLGLDLQDFEDRWREGALETTDPQMATLVKWLTELRAPRAEPAPTGARQLAR
jgi:hypothetical protein